MEFSKRKFASLISIVMAVSILFTGTIFYVLAPTASNTIVIEGGIYPGAPTYTIWKVDSTHYAKDFNGQLAFLSSAFSTVMQRCINALYSSGGYIFISDGSYSAKTTIQVNTTKGIIIRGSGADATELHTQSGYDGTLINFTVSPVTQVSYLEYLEIDGWDTATSHCGVEVHSKTQFTSVYVKNFGGAGDVGVKLYISNCYFYDFRASNCETSVHLVTIANNINFFGGSFYSNAQNGTLIKVTGGDTLHVYGTDFEASPTKNVTAIYVEWNNSFMRLIGARFEDVAYGIYWKSGIGDYDVVLACSMSGTYSNFTINEPATSNITMNYEA